MFWKKKKVETGIQRILNAMKILQEEGLYIKEIYATEEFVNKARKSRKAIDKNGNNIGLLKMDTEFDMWVDKEKLPKKNYKNVEGMLFGVKYKLKKR